MRIQVFQHVPFEGIGSMAADFQRRNWPVTTTHWYRGDHPPTLESFDALVVMGGPMGVYDEAQYPWLAREKELIEAVIAADKYLIGICLGAQLIACALGAEVRRNSQREIGWFPLVLRTAPEDNPLGYALPEHQDVFHWHGDTFALPDGARWLASSAACAHQAFSLGEKIFGFQFHLETTEDLARALIRECGDELEKSTFVQSAEEILADGQRFAAVNQVMSNVLESIFQSTSS